MTTKHRLIALAKALALAVLVGLFSHDIGKRAGVNAVISYLEKAGCTVSGSAIR